MAFNKKKSIYIIIVILIIGAISAYNYIYPDHRDIKKEQPGFVLTSKALISEFSNNALKSEKKFLNKTIEVSGLISEINESNLVLEDKLFCQFQNSISNIPSVNTKITIKGRCIGYDDLLEEIKLDQCTIIK